MFHSEINPSVKFRAEIAAIRRDDFLGSREETGTHGFAEFFQKEQHRTEERQEQPVVPFEVARSEGRHQWRGIKQQQ
jgi:hypothetical protein